MQQVFKYPLTEGENEVLMPQGAEILAAVLSAQGPTLLALVRPDEDLETRSFLVVGNGVDLPEGVSALHYRGAVKIPGDATWNIFETTEVTASA